MQPGVTVGTSDPNSPKSVTRVLQHSILQLCNEHISYNHTLQVLGVLCLTIDDKQQELVVKVNNTLKRVNPVTPPKDTLPFQPPSLPRGEAEFCFPVSEVPLMYEGVCANGAFPTNAYDRRRPENHESPGTSHLGRKGHGRKQTNPVRVKHVFDEADGNISGGDVLTIEPTHPESPCTPGGDMQDPLMITDNVSQLNKKCIGGIRRPKRKISDVFSSTNNGYVDNGNGSGIEQQTGSTMSSNNQGSSGENILQMSIEDSSSVGKQNESSERLAVCDDSGDESHDSGCSQQLVVIAPDDISSPENPDDADAPVAEVGALNFSMCALNGGTTQSEKTTDVGGVAGGCLVAIGTAPVSSLNQEFQNGLQTDLGTIRIKDEMKNVYPIGFDFGLNANSYDVSQNLAIRTTFVDDRRFLPASAVHCSIANGHIAPQNSLIGNELSTSNATLRSCYLGGDLTGATGIHLLDENYLRNMVNGLSVAQVVGPASYTISSCLKDGLTMHLTKTRTKERALLGGTSMKVKDIIMYDDSAPLHTQKGNKIEGDFMLDSLNVEGKKRRRRTAEDALTSEEIAEYMGSCDRGPCSFKCKYCNEVCADLSRYFNHTLVKHNSFICHQCGKNFTTKSSLLRHRPIHTGMRRFACSICKKSFYRKDKCKAHIKRHLGLSSDQQEKYPQANVAST